MLRWQLCISSAQACRTAPAPARALRRTGQPASGSAAVGRKRTVRAAAATERRPATLRPRAAAAIAIYAPVLGSLCATTGLAIVSFLFFACSHSGTGHS